MSIELTDRQIKEAKVKADTETNRDIYSISITDQEIIINGDWSIERDGTPILQNTVTAIKEYCTRKNIDWEWRSTYSAWCD